MNTECNCATCRRKQAEGQLAQAQARIAELELENSWLQDEMANAADSGAEAQARIAELEAALKVIRDSPYRPVEDCASVARTALEKSHER